MTNATEQEFVKAPWLTVQLPQIVFPTVLVIQLTELALQEHLWLKIPLAMILTIVLKVMSAMVLELALVPIPPKGLSAMTMISVPMRPAMEMESVLPIL